MTSHQTIINGQKQPTLVPTMLRNDPKPPNTVQNGLKSCQKISEIVQKWSKLVQDGSKYSKIQ